LTTPHAPLFRMFVVVKPWVTLARDRSPFRGGTGFSVAHLIDKVTGSLSEQYWPWTQATPISRGRGPERSYRTQPHLCTARRFEIVVFLANFHRQIKIDSS